MQYQLDILHQYLLLNETLIQKHLLQNNRYVIFFSFISINNTIFYEYGIVFHFILLIFHKILKLLLIIKFFYIILSSLAFTSITCILSSHWPVSWSNVSFSFCKSSIYTTAILTIKYVHLHIIPVIHPYYFLSGTIMFSIAIEIWLTHFLYFIIYIISFMLQSQNMYYLAIFLWQIL